MKTVSPALLVTTLPVSAPKTTWVALLTALTLAAGPAWSAEAGAAATPTKPATKATRPAAARAAVAPASGASQAARSSADIIATAPAAAWRDVDPDNLLIMTLPQGEALIELAPRFAPKHAQNIRALARGGYWDGLAILRVQDNYVTQWGDPDADDEDTGVKGKSKPFPAGAEAHLPAEFDVPLKGLPLTVLPDVDGWAPRAGHVDGFPVAANPATGRAWMAHCYATVGAGRGNDVDSSTGAELYVVIGHAPRGLDLNITVVGRVLKGMEALSALPRGTGRLGFYEKPEQRQPITRVVLASTLPPDQRPPLQVLRTDTPTWQALLEARRHRGGWFVHSPEHTEICTAAAPVRTRPTDVKLEKIVSPESKR
ncbi:peptidylprolyl isomerase [Roseateles sp. YR242]|uniref:peptidylprolyl isomerase n=1 Tax=Roseateles sp. YR242 TaxID=1855305 RepID=UPI0008C43A14|nr:peptidylprolyl isomerase [Roseateles sp. YR242]SEL42952.1 peptidylprolyl isomerase [Roseateles sp. YR242]